MRLREVVRGADLGSSSNYSDEIHPTLWELLALKTVVLVNGNQTRVSRS